MITRRLTQNPLRAGGKERKQFWFIDTSLLMQFKNTIIHLLVNYPLKCHVPKIKSFLCIIENIRTTDMKIYMENSCR